MDDGNVKTYQDYNIDLNGASGIEVRVICPECSPKRKKQKIKDLCVNTEKQTWFCHHCGWKDGLKSNARVYIKPKFNEIEKLPEHVLKWFEGRKISEHILKKTKIGYGPIWMPAVEKKVNAIQFPFYKHGSVVNIKYRDGQKNFRQAKNAEKCFYGFDTMMNENEYLIICEGEMDQLSFLECGYSEVVSIPDGTPPENAKNYTTKFDFLKSAEKCLMKYKKIILAVDGDKPGRRAEEELARRIGSERCYRVKYPDGCKDANDVLVKFGKKDVKKLVKKAKPFPIKGLFQASDFQDRLERIYDCGVEKGTGTGWTGLDKYFTARPGELTIITGIPSSGKSNFLDCLMLNLIDTGSWKFAVYSPENWPIERHLQTLCEKISVQPFSQSFGDKYPRMERGLIEEITSHIDDNINFIQPPEESDGTIEEILNLAKKALFRNGINALIIDPWNEVSHDFGKMTETQYISKQLGKIRRFGRLNGVHIFIVAHPQKLQKNNEGKYDAPDMYSIAGGAHFRNKADNGICVHRLYGENKDHVQIIVQKIRFRDVGKPGMHKLRFEYATGRYNDDLFNG